MPSLCLDHFKEGTVATPSSSLFISDSLEFTASIVLVSLLEKLVFETWIKECYYCQCSVCFYVLITPV